ncbi:MULTISPECIES: sigma D regulator [Gammaproteobacteria]|uniref:sigma D regulator n=1 Tax=Gammaproteobacteria TaxID=1236 RepID=UPI000DD07DAB|nr:MULTISPECIES: sigma D regulator [Gammaproteobacteria]RTE85709.1 sigma D regulator [Aliidiomarina sp. B3213]TCZ90291.1 sigma D regulator [Lysobacter sp. N42]
MLRRNEEAKQRWGGQDQSIDRWLEERQLLLIQYCKLAGLPPYAEHKGQLPSLQDIHDFCETLVDYVSAGHFELYDHILEQADAKDPHTQQVAEQVYPLLAITTEAALKFNDAYGDTDDDKNLKQFDVDLSAVGEAVEARLELEDKLLQLLSHKDLIEENAS